MGSQIKINMVVRRLPRLRSGLDPEIAFAGTLHLGQGYARLQQAYEEAAAGRMPDPLPCEVYCHSLTDPSILGDELAAAGYHTLTLFGLHTPVDLFRADPDRRSERAPRAALPLAAGGAGRAAGGLPGPRRHGRPCLEVMTPLDLETELGLPGGHIFHGDLQWPWLADDAEAATPAERWGVATEHAGRAALRLRRRPRRRRQRARRPQRGHGRARRDLRRLRPSACRIRGDYSTRSGTQSRLGSSSAFASLAPRAPLAQLAEQLTLNQRVGGSIPSRRTNLLVKEHLDVFN